MDSRGLLFAVLAAVVGGAIALLALRGAGLLRERPEYLSLAVDPAPPARPAPPEGAPHVVLVIGCTVRRDQTSLHGGPAHTTPFLVELAAQGATFDDMIAAAPWTRAASTALLTGRHPVGVGMVDDHRGRNEHALPPQVDTLAELLRGAGWATAGVTLNPNLNDVYGFDQGFDVYLQTAALWRERPVKILGRSAVRRLDDLLDALPEAVPESGPRFLQLMLIDAHQPLFPTEAQLAAHADPDVPGRVVRYRTGLRMLDDAVRALHGALEARGFTRDNTLFVVVNDHGEGLDFPRHHGRGHGRYLSSSAVGGVWVATGPGIPEGLRVRGLASQVDLLPTLAGYLGLALPDTRMAHDPGRPARPGYDLSPQLTGEAPPTTPRKVAYTATFFREVRRAAAYSADRACQRSFGFTVQTGETIQRFREACFDREADPLHLEPIREPGLRYLLDQWRGLMVREARAFGPAPVVEPDEGLSAQLEALGYVGDDAPEGGGEADAAP